MKVCKGHSDYQNNGLITKIWGEPAWIANHAITFGYPLDPSDEQKKKYRNYFTSLGDVLPCRYCRESYQVIISTGDTALTDEALKNRESLTKWFYRVHEKVNQKLEIDYGLTYEDIVDKYESFRARCGKPKVGEKGCIVPLDYKAMSFKKLYYRDCPIIPIEFVEPFIKQAKARGMPEYYFLFIKLAKLLNNDYTQLKKQSSWTERNNLCYNIIKHMRTNNIPSLESDGIPSTYELILLLFLSSNLNKTELKNAALININ